MSEATEPSGTAGADPGIERAPGRRYSAVAITFHWLIAALILTNLYLGLRMASEQGLAKFNTFQLHKSVGVTVLALSVLRLVWRLMHRPPAYPETMKRWERVAAHAVHAGFYALMIATPLTGWVIVSASPLNIPTILYKTIPFPYVGFVHSMPMATRKIVEEQVGDLHVTFAFLFAGLIVLHVAAALKHHFVQRDNVLRRMLPFVAVR